MVRRETAVGKRRTGRWMVEVYRSLPMFNYGVDFTADFVNTGAKMFYRPRRLSDFVGLSTLKDGADPDLREAPNGQWAFVGLSIVYLLYLHGAAIYGLYLVLDSANIATFVFAWILAVVSAIGATACTRCMSSREEHDATSPMIRLILVLLHTLAFQQSVVEWVHHDRTRTEFPDTIRNDDSSDSWRSYFFSHVGWFLGRRDSEASEKGKNVDMSDLENDPVVAWQHRYFSIVGSLLCFVVPTLVPWYYWNESLWISWHGGTMFRYALVSNCTWLLDSVAFAACKRS